MTVVPRSPHMKGAWTEGGVSELEKGDLYHKWARQRVLRVRFCLTARLAKLRLGVLDLLEVSRVAVETSEYVVFDTWWLELARTWFWLDRMACFVYDGAMSCFLKITSLICPRPKGRMYMC